MVQYKETEYMLETTAANGKCREKFTRRRLFLEDKDEQTWNKECF